MTTSDMELREIAWTAQENAGETTLADLELVGLQAVWDEATRQALFEASQFIYDELLGAPIEVRIKARALLRRESAKHERENVQPEEGE